MTSLWKQTKKSRHRRRAHISVVYTPFFFPCGNNRSNGMTSISFLYIIVPFEPKISETTTNLPDPPPLVVIITPFLSSSSSLNFYFSFKFLSRSVGVVSAQLFHESNRISARVTRREDP